MELINTFLKIRLTRSNQIILIGALCLMSFYLLISLISFLSNYTSNLKKENEITINRIEFLSAINDQEIVSRTNFSNNLASSVNSSAINNNLNIDRSLPLSNNEISIWINESNFVDLFNWLIEINNNNVEITKMNIRRVSKDSVSAQLTFKS